MNREQRRARNQAIVAAYNNGTSTLHIAVQYNLSQATIMNILTMARAEGLVTREPRTHTVADEGRINDIVSRYQAGATLSELGDAHGISRERIRQILEAQGINRRPRGFPHSRLYEEFVATHGATIDADFDELRSISHVVNRHRGTVPAAYIRRYLAPRANESIRRKARNPIWTDEQLLEVVRAAAAGRDTLTIPQYTRWRNSGATIDGRRPPTIAVIQWRFGTWRDAVTRAGMVTNPLRRSYSRRWSERDALTSVRTFAEVALAKGQRPTYFAYQEWARTNPGNPSGPYVRHLVGRTWSDTLREALSK